MDMNPSKKHRLIVVLVVGFALSPIVLYWQVIGRVPRVAPQEAQGLVSEGKAVLLDIRDPQAFERSRVVNAENWPFESIRALGSAEHVPEQWRGKKLLLLCDSGIFSAIATSKLRGLGVTEVFSVSDGIMAYPLTGRVACSFDVVRGLFTGKEAAPVRESPLIEQAALVLTGFGVKPFYMALSFLLAVILWRSVSADLVALRWGMAFFFFGEAACAFNYLVFNLQSHFWEYLHSLGMVISFGYLTYALFEGLDLRLVHLSEPTAKCAAIGLCRTCQQRTGGPCGLERCFLWLSAAVWIVAWMPFCVPTHPVSYNTTIFGTVYNYSHSVIYQVFESRLCPIAALAMFAACFGVLALKKGERVETAKILFALGMGPLSFSFFRLLVFQVYRDNLVWFNFWEEMTECILVLAVVVILWVFRSALFAKPAHAVSD